MKKTDLKKAVLNGTCLVFFMLLLIACGSAKNSNCIDESKISTGPCTMEYNPVCGCDGKTYSNPCQAKRAGLTSWEAGKCAEN